MLCEWRSVTPSLSLRAGDNLIPLSIPKGGVLPAFWTPGPYVFLQFLECWSCGSFRFPTAPCTPAQPHPPCWSPAWPTVPFLCWREKGFPSSRQMWPQDTQLDELNVAGDQLPLSLTPFPSLAPLPTARTPQPGRARMVAPSKWATFRLLQ